MANNNISSEEDYLDSLLKSVLGNEDSKDSDRLNSDELTDDDLGSIEKDLFSEGMDDVDNLILNELGESPDVTEKIPEKKEKKRLFGRKKKTEKSDEAVHTDKVKSQNELEEKSVSVPEKPEDNSQQVEMDGIFSDVSEEEAALPVIPEGFEGLFGGEEGTEEDTTENNITDTDSIDENMQGLYDILGVSGTDEESDYGEIEKLEEEKPLKKKKREKRKKKSRKEKKGKGINDIQPLEEANYANDDVLSDFPDTDAQDSDMYLDDFGNLFTGGDESMGGEEPPMMDENEQLIQDMDDGIYDESDIMSDESEEEKPKKKKEKKKKEKKPKKEKVKKPKKVKAKKEKKPKKPDEIIPIPRVFLIFSASVIVLLVVFLLVGGKYKNYNNRTANALTYYMNMQYEEAYNELVGLEMKSDEDQAFFDQIQTIMYVQRHYSAYKSLYEMELYDQALFSLLRGVKTYDKYKDQARAYNCFDDMTIVLGWIDSALLEKFGLTESEAREMNLMTSRREYSNLIYEIADKAAVMASQENSENSEYDSDNGTETENINNTLE